MTTIKCYSELILLPTFQARYQYLRLNGEVGKETFGFDRYMNQFFYRSPEWRRVRDFVISRDEGCDLGIPGREIFGRVIIHHMNPIRPEDPQQKRTSSQSGIPNHHNSRYAPRNSLWR